MAAAPRFFVEAACAPGVEIELAPDDAHHAAGVLRLTAGERVVLIDASGPWTAQLTSATKHAVRARVMDAAAEDSGELPVDLTVLQALVKGAKFDEVVEKTVELGARCIVPVQFARSLHDAAEQRVDRWRRIAKSAAQQARRRVLPVVEAPREWSEVMPSTARAMPLIVAWEHAASGSLAGVCERIGSSTKVAIAVGPEGGLSAKEVEEVEAAGCILVSLGPTILRTETAAAVLIAALASACGWW